LLGSGKVDYPAVKRTVEAQMNSQGGE